MNTTMYLIYTLIIVGICYAHTIKAKPDGNSSPEDDTDINDDDSSSPEEYLLEDILRNRNYSKKGSSTDLGKEMSKPIDDFSSKICGDAIYQMNYTYVENMGVYKFYEEKKHWYAASAQCTKDGGYLAIIDCFNEHEVLHRLRSIMSNDKSKKVSWINLNEIEMYHPWKNFAEISYSDNFPEYAKEKFCDALLEKRYEMYYCGTKLSFFCEHKCGDIVNNNSEKRLINMMMKSHWNRFYHYD